MLLNVKLTYLFANRLVEMFNVSRVEMQVSCHLSRELAKRNM